VLCFPRAIEHGRRCYTARLHAIVPLDDSALAASLEPCLAPATFRIYRPEDGRSFSPDHTPYPDGVVIGAPSAAEVAAARRLQQTIWQSRPGDLYPDDLHSHEFAAGTSLVARRDQQVIGFLFGFIRFGSVWSSDGLAIESQVLGVDPAFRGLGLARMLKQAQAKSALSRGITVIHWTADPLQFANAALNFGKLRAVAGDFAADYYPFQNALNRVPASRLRLTWLPGTPHGRAGLHEPAHLRPTLADLPGCVLLNNGPAQSAEPEGAAMVAIEVPADWTRLQREDLASAQRWRNVTDTIFQATLGFRSDRYVLVDVAVSGHRRFLIASRFNQALADRLAGA
jgi:predicted GNAT superfamily acetyltransferase